MIITKGQKITYKPEWQDAGDSGITFIALENESGGRVLAEAQLGLTLNPTQIVNVEWIAAIEDIKS